MKCKASGLQILLTDKGQNDGEQWSCRDVDRVYSLHVIQQVDWKITIKIRQFINVTHNRGRNRNKFVQIQTSKSKLLPFLPVLYQFGKVNISTVKKERKKLTYKNENLMV